MKSKIFTPRFIFITSAILIAAVSRLFPHIPNFTPVAAMALFGGVNFSDKKMAFFIPLVAMFLSDVALQLMFGWGFHNTMIYVYIAFVLTSIIGMMVRRNVSVLSIGAASIISSVLFFIITNFGVWAASGYSMGLAGLNTTYLLGLPFFAPTLVGDLLFNGILFGSFYFVQTKYPVLVKA
ncbi:MAG: DUF6580 family putative transport protein [Bacteroidota bacterium]